MSSGPHTSAEQPFDKARFWRLLARYFLGVAIGCVLVGAILQLKRHYMVGSRPPGSPTSEQAPAPPPPPAAQPAK